jgi:SAM-dependent methyltransferase
MHDPRADLARNRALWTDVNAQFTNDAADRAWAATEVSWGVFEVPERELRVLGDVAGLDVVELGCGTAYFSSWLARNGARPVGVDVTLAQLETAHACMARFGISFPLVAAGAEDVPLHDGSFDLAVSEYGASVWCDPARWVPEAARLLKPAGRLVFLTNSTLVALCVPEDGGDAGEQLQRPQWGMYREQWPGGGVEFHIGHGEWIRILRDSGFEVVALHELFAPADAHDHDYYEIATAAWARRWPVEDLWVAVKR